MNLSDKVEKDGVPSPKQPQPKPAVMKSAKKKKAAVVAGEEWREREGGRVVELRERDKKQKNKLAGDNFMGTKINSNLHIHIVYCNHSAQSSG